MAHSWTSYVDAFILLLYVSNYFTHGVYSQPVGHYTIAGVYLSLSDYVAASLHLRAALHISVFKEALLSLKLIRCSIKFKEEQVFLRKKMHEKELEIQREEESRIIEELTDAVLNGKTIEQKTQPPLIVENIEPPEIPEMKVQEMVSSTYTGENAIRYLTSLALLARARFKKRDMLESQDTSRDEPSEADKSEQSDVSPNVTDEPANDNSSTDNLSNPKENATSGEEVVPTIPSSNKDTQTDEVAPTIHSSNKTVSDLSSETASESKANSQSDSKSIEVDPDVEKILEKAADAIKNGQSPVLQKTPPKVKRKRKTRDEIREEEIQRRFPGTRPWPTMEDCNEKPPPKKLVFTSTWLSVTAKGAR